MKSAFSNEHSADPPKIKSIMDWGGVRDFGKNEVCRKYGPLYLVKRRYITFFLPLTAAHIYEIPHFYRVEVHLR